MLVNQEALFTNLLNLLTRWFYEKVLRTGCIPTGSYDLSVVWTRDLRLERARCL